MKKLCVVYANCQGDGMVHFLKKTPMGKEYDFLIWHNWQLMMGEQDVDDFLGSIVGLQRSGGVFIYQPTTEYPAKNGVMVPNTDQINQQLAIEGVTQISFSYQFNTGFFPFIKIGQGWDGWIAPTDMKEQAKKAVVLGQRGGMVIDFYADKFQYDCARRFVECLAEQARREETTDIKTVPWILQNYRRCRLFLSNNHPTSELFMELASQVYRKVMPADAYACLLPADENEVQMNSVAPVHPAVVRELGLEYQPTDGSIEYYRDLLEQMIKELR